MLTRSRRVLHQFNADMRPPAPIAESLYMVITMTHHFDSSLVGCCRRATGATVRHTYVRLTYDLRMARTSAAGLFRLPQQLPKNIAMELILTGDRLPCEKMLQFGFVNTMTDPGTEVSVTWMAHPRGVDDSST